MPHICFYSVVVTHFCLNVGRKGILCSACGRMVVKPTFLTMALITVPTRTLTAAVLALLSWAVNPTATHAQLPDYPPTEGLVGWWPFNGNANDESGNGNDGVVIGATLTEHRDGNLNAAYLSVALEIDFFHGFTVIGFRCLPSGCNEYITPSPQRL